MCEEQPFSSWNPAKVAFVFFIALCEIPRGFRCKFTAVLAADFRHLKERPGNRLLSYSWLSVHAGGGCLCEQARQVRLEI